MWLRKVKLWITKISIKWLWPVKVTLKVIKRRLQVFLLILWRRPFKIRLKKISEPPVYQYGSNEYTLDPPSKWSVNAFNSHFLFIYFSYYNTFHRCRLSGRKLLGVPSRDLNSGLFYSKPCTTIWATLHPLSYVATWELRCTLLSYTACTRWTTLHPELRCPLRAMLYPWTHCSLSYAELHFDWRGIKG